MSHKILVAFFSLLLVLGTQTSAFAAGKPHHRHVKKVKKVKKPHHRTHMR